MLRLLPLFSPALPAGPQWVLNADEKNKGRVQRGERGEILGLASLICKMGSVPLCSIEQKSETCAKHSVRDSGQNEGTKEGVNGVHWKNTLERRVTGDRRGENKFFMSPDLAPGTCSRPLMVGKKSILLHP